MGELSPESSSCLSTGTRCVVLAGSGVSAPGDLLEGLSSRGVGVVVVSEPAYVMLELAKRHTGAVIVIEPGRQPWLEPLDQALRHYHPKTVRWCYLKPHNGQSARLLRLDAFMSSSPPFGRSGNGSRDDALAFPRAHPRSPLSRAQSQIPRERMRSLLVKVPGQSGTTEPLISEEELSMLLGPMPKESEAGHE
ncbi:MAG: hypothetical protein Kow00105_10270 [Phycisphaeraceae bacterium]